MEFVKLLQNTLQFRYQHSWTYLLPSLASAIRFVGPPYPMMISEIIQQLVAIYDSSIRGDAT